METKTISITQNAITEYDRYRFTTMKVVKSPMPILSIQGSLIASPGNLVVLSGGSKTGKSYAAGAIISGNLVADPASIETLGISIYPNQLEEGVVYINTELGPHDFHKYCKSIFRRANIKTDLDFFWAVDFCGMNPAELMENTFKLTNQVYEKHRVRLIVIDGVADFVGSVNNEEDCNEVISNLQGLARELDAVILLIIHNNPVTGKFETKARGHLGSQLERKCESFLEVKKDKGNNHSVLSAKLLRNAGGFDPILFVYDPSKGYPVSKGNKLQVAIFKKELKKVNKLEALLTRINKESTTKGHIFSTSDLKSIICSEYKIEDRRSEDVIRDLEQKGQIIRDKRGHYRLP